MDENLSEILFNTFQLSVAAAAYSSKKWHVQMFYIRLRPISEKSSHSRNVKECMPF